MDYADKQMYLALLSAAEEGDQQAAQELRDSFEEAQKAAETGDAAAQFSMALHYDYGFGTEEDEEASFTWFEKAAMQGHAGAMSCLAWAYVHGKGVEPDKNKSSEWERKAAIAYFKEGAYGSALHAIWGNDYRDDKEINALVSKIQQKMVDTGGYAEGLCRIGELFRLGNDVPQDPERALELYRLSAERDYFWGQYQLGMYYQGKLEGVPNASPDFAKAFEWHSKAAQHNNPQAEYELGNLYRYGIGVAQDRDKALEWIDKAADHNNTEAKQAQKELVDEIIKEKGAYVCNIDMTQPNSADKLYKKGTQLLSYGYGDVAVPLLQMAADRGHAEAQYTLADHLYNPDEGGDSQSEMEKLFPHNEQALELYRKAAEQGHAQSQLLLGLYYQDSLKGIPNESPDHAKAAEWYEKAAANGGTYAQYLLADMYRTGEGVFQNIEKAIELYEKAAKWYHTEAQYALGLYYSGNLANVMENAAIDYDKALKWLKDPAEQDIGDAKEIITEIQAMSEEEKFNKELFSAYNAGDFERAVALFTRAAEQGHAEAQFLFGLYCKDDIAGIDNANKDLAKAKDLFEKSAAQGHAGGQLELGDMYFDGEGVTQDKAKGVELWEKAAEQGHAAAQNNMGYAFQHGEGVAHDYAKAFEWYAKAAEQGNPVSMKHLGELYRDGLGVEKDIGKAKEWFVKAAQQGNEKAQKILEEMGVDIEEETTSSTTTENVTVTQLEEIIPIIIKHTPAASPLPVGASKFHGKPDLWEGFQWPTTLYTDKERTAFQFFCQINCAEASRSDKNGLLPKTGMLYFFRERGGVKPSGQSVYYYDGDISALKPAESPPVVYIYLTPDDPERTAEAVVEQAPVYPEQAITFESGEPNDLSDILMLWDKAHQFMDWLGDRQVILRLPTSFFDEDSGQADWHEVDQMVCYHIDKKSLANRKFGEVNCNSVHGLLDSNKEFETGFEKLKAKLGQTPNAHWHNILSKMTELADCANSNVHVYHEDAMLAYLEIGGRYYALEDYSNALDLYERGIDVLREYLVTQAIDCELYDDTEPVLETAFGNMLRIYKRMGREKGEQAANLISIFKYIGFSFVEEIVKKENFDITGYAYYKTIQGTPDWAGDSEGENVTRRILLYMQHEGLTYTVTLDFYSETDSRSRNKVYKFHSAGGDEDFHKTETAITGDEYKEVYEMLTGLTVEQATSEADGDYNKEIYFSLTLYDEFGDFALTFSGVNRKNIKQRKLEKVCAIATRMLEISDFKGTKFAPVIDALRSK